MKQLNHSPEAAAAVLGVSLKVAYERIARVRQQSASRSLVHTVPTVAPRVYARLTRSKNPAATTL